LHAKTYAGAIDAAARAGLLRYVLRPPLSQERLTVGPGRAISTGSMGHVRKTTANIPEDILENAQRLTGKGITLTLVEELKALDRNTRLSALRRLRGKVEFHLDLDRTRR
jgi:hypothetical protein